MVAAEVLSPPQSIAAQAFATNELMLCPSLHRFFADEASLAVESRMTASGAERLSGILDGCLKLGAAPGTTAIMPDFDSELGHSYSPDSPVVADLFF
jgi:hypothetical protein